MNIFQFILNLVGFDVESFSSKLFYLAGIIIAFFSVFTIGEASEKIGRLSSFGVAILIINEVN